ncbi:MAG: hypothetical protein WC100_05905 [Sterolibacterium sp.]
MSRVPAMIAALLVLWLPFSVTAILAVVLAPLALLVDEWTYGKDLLRAMDKLGAALLGWGGRYTVSAECGSRKSECRLCRFVCRLLDIIDPGHCKGAAQREFAEG